MSEATLRFTLEAASQIALGEPVWIDLVLENRGTGPVLVNGRLAVDEASGLARLHEVSLTVKGPNGQALPFMLDVNGVEPTPADFVVLAAGARHSRRVRLDTPFRMSETGSYSVVGLYHNDVAHERVGLQAFLGALRSEVISLPLR